MHSGGVTLTSQLHQLNLRCWSSRKPAFLGLITILCDVFDFKLSTFEFLYYNGHDKGIIADDDTAWGEIDYLFGCIFILVTLVDDIVSLLIDHVQHFFALWGVKHDKIGHSPSFAVWGVDDYDFFASAFMTTTGLVLIGATLTSDIIDTVLFGFSDDVTVIDINAHHRSWNDGEHIDDVCRHNFDSVNYDCASDDSRMPQVVRSTTSFVRCYTFTICAVTRCRLIHTTRNFTHVHRHFLSHRQELHSSCNYAFGSTRASASAFFINPSSSVAQSPTFYEHQIQSGLIKYITSLSDDRYIDLSVKTWADNWGEGCCDYNDVVNRRSAHAKDVSDKSSLECFDTFSLDCLNTDGDIAKYYANLPLWLIRVRRSRVGIDVSSLCFSIDCQLIQFGITYQIYWSTSTSHRAYNLADFNIFDFSGPCIIRRILLKELFYDEMHNTELRASLSTTVDVIDSAIDTYSCAESDMGSSNVSGSDDMLISRRFARRRDSGHAIFIGLDRLCIQLGADLSKSSDGIVDNGNSTSLNATQYASAVASGGEMRNVRTTSCWITVQRHVFTDDRSSRQHGCSRLNTAPEVVLPMLPMLPRHFAWLLHIIALNVGIVLLDYGEKVFAGICWMQYALVLVVTRMLSYWRAYLTMVSLVTTVGECQLSASLFWRRVFYGSQNWEYLIVGRSKSPRVMELVWKMHVSSSVYHHRAITFL